MGSEMTNEPRLGDGNFVCTTYYDESFSILGDLCLRSLRYYASRHDMELAYLTDVRTERPPAWCKILIVLELLQRGYQWVMWVDADALVVDASRSPREFLEAGKDLYLHGHMVGTRRVPNTGIFVVRNSEWSRSFFQRVWQLTQYVHHKWWENAAVIHLVSPEDFSDHDIPGGREIIDDGRVKWLGPEWNSIPDIDGGYSACADPVIRHWLGRPMKLRRRGMLRDFHQTPVGQRSAPAAKDLLRGLYSSTMPRPC